MAVFYRPAGPVDVRTFCADSRTVMRWRLFGDRTSLRAAAATIFALTAILPLSTLVIVLWRAGLLDDPATQVNVLLALVLALLGFVLFQHLVRRIAFVAEAVHGGEAPADTVIPAVGRVSEISAITDAFSGLLAELRTSTDRLSDSVVKLGTLNDLAELGSRIPALRDLLEVVLERTMRTVHASIGSIMLLDPERQTLRIAASRGLTDVADVEINVGEGIAGKVAQAGDPVVVENIETDPRFARANDPKYGSGSFICLPVRARDHVIGVINLARKESTAVFSATDLYFLNALMTNVGYAVDNARMLQDSRQSADRLQQALDDVNAAQARLVQGETLRALGELTSGMAHHLNNLLAVILGRVELLLTDADDPAHRERLDTVRRAGLDAADVVRRMLRFTQGQGFSELTPVDVNALAAEVIDLLRPRWDDEAHLRAIRIDLRFEPSELPTTRGDAAAIREVMMNLLVNAIEALPQGGRIVVKTWLADDGIHCSIADSGTGMSEALRARAPEPFFTTKGPKGTGLGLSASYGILEQHGGDLSIDSAEGEGTTVTIRLPAAGAPPPTFPAAPPPPAPRGLRILLIDDQRNVRRALADVLMAEGHHVVDVSGGADGLARLERQEPFDAVFTDLGMPDMTGWQVARAVKARWPKLTVVVITGWQEDAQGGEDDRAAVDFMIPKPVTVDALRDVTRRIRTE
jgi:signal transduction histidine kinase/CheY-like chemotaxis protein